MSVRILQGDALTVLRTLPSESVQLVCTSPPYYSLRAYNTEPKVWGGDPEHDHEWGELAQRLNNRHAMAVREGLDGKNGVGNYANPKDWNIKSGVCPCGAWRGELGLEPTPAMFIEHLMLIFDEVRRVLRKDGLLFCNIGDSYSGSGKGPTGHNGLQNAETRQGFESGYLRANGEWSKGGRKSKTEGTAGIPAKNLLLIPERFAIAMQGFAAVPGAGLIQMADELAAARQAGDWLMVEAVESQLRIWASWCQVFDGWIVRSRIAWCKKAPMPESANDRPSSAWEHIYMFSRSRTYFYDAEAVRQPLAEGSISRLAQPYNQAASGYRAINGAPDGDRSHLLSQGANLRNFWMLGPAPSSLEHYASFPPEIPRRCILAGTSERGACSACGSPWVRVVERESVARTFPGVGLGIDERKATNNGGSGGYVKALTTGWAPSCACDAGPHATCPTCGHAGSDHRSQLGCIEPLLAPDGETWLGCPCNLEVVPLPPRPCVVLDPFLGSGTSLLVADRLGRSGIGVELNPAYAEMARRRIASDAGSLFGEAVTVEAGPQQLGLLESLG